MSRSNRISSNSFPSNPPPSLWMRLVGEVVTMYGEIDLATHEIFSAALDALVDTKGSRDPSGDAHLDLAGVRFIDVEGARLLVDASAKFPPPRQLVVHHPSPMLVRIIELGWGGARGPRLLESRRYLHDADGTEPTVHRTGA